jgi:class 3 adenylate cyclase
LRRVTISAKIFSIAVGLLLIMALVALFTTRMTNLVSGELRVLGENYLPGSAALGKADTASGDEALWVRRLFIDYLDADSDGEDIARIKTQIATTAAETDDALAEARRLINRQIDEPLDFDDNIELARLDTRLELLQEDRVTYESFLAKVIESIDSNKPAEFRRLMAPLDRLRDDFDRKLDFARAEMQRLAHGAAEATRTYQARTVFVSSMLLLIAGALGLAVAAFVTKGLVRPVLRLLEGTAVVERGKLDIDIPVTSGDEIGRLTEAFNRMVGELRIKERIRHTFGKYVDPRIVQGLIDRPDLNRNEGERRVMTILFCDMKGFTSLSEGLTPTALVTVINRYLTLLSQPVRENDGIIDKYIGDAIMAYWGPPFCAPEEQARLACLAALEQIEAVQRLTAELPELLGITRNIPEVSVRIGIATGEVVVGDIGSDVAKGYTVMGDTVNLASRLEGANKSYGSHILINDKAAAMAGETLELREIDSILVVGKSEPQRVYEVLGRKGQVAAEQLSKRDRFVAGLDSYRRRKFAEARAAFAQVLASDAADAPAQVFLQRIEMLMSEPPDEAWNGVWALNTK